MGASYPNRKDMQTGPRVSDVGPSKEYGSRVAQEDQVRAIQQSGALQQSFTPSAGPAPAPPPFVDLDAPTQHPERPVTHGLPVGPGAGPEVLGVPSPDDTALATLRALYGRFPHPDILDLIQFEEERR